MREHGAGNFPDLRVHVGPNHVTIRQVVKASVVNSPKFRAAAKACRSIMPGIPRPGILSPGQTAVRQRARERTLLAFTRCLRAHGLPGFPDPTPQGELSRQAVTAAGIDLHAPKVLTAAEACVGVTHGAITMADVKRAIDRNS